MSNVHGMPPYADTVFHGSTFRQLDLKLVGLLCWLIAHAQPLGEGTWGIADTNQDTLARHIGTSRPTLSKMLATLHAHGYIHTHERIGYGRGNGGSSQTHYLTYHPSLGVPTNPERPSNKAPYKNRTTQKGPMQNRPLQVVRPHDNPVERSTMQQLNDQQPVLSVHNKTEQQTAKIPNGLRDALAAIGYDLDAFPLPHDIDPTDLIAVIAYADHSATITKKAKWVHTQIHEVGLTESIRRNNIPTLGRPTPSVARMDPVEYDQLADQHPEWAARVAAEASRRATEAGRPYTPPSLIWAVAAEMGRPDSHTETG